jgi:hypothetical protein
MVCDARSRRDSAVSRPLHDRFALAASKPSERAGRIASMKQRFVRVGDELADDVTVTVRGGVLDPELLGEDARRNYANASPRGIGAPPRPYRRVTDDHPLRPQAGPRPIKGWHPCPIDPIRRLGARSYETVHVNRAAPSEVGGSVVQSLDFKSH